MFSCTIRMSNIMCNTWWHGKWWTHTETETHSTLGIWSSGWGRKTHRSGMESTDRLGWYRTTSDLSISMWNVRLCVDQHVQVYCISEHTSSTSVETHSHILLTGFTNDFGLNVMDPPFYSAFEIDSNILHFGCQSTGLPLITHNICTHNKIYIQPEVQ